MSNCNAHQFHEDEIRCDGCGCAGSIRWEDTLLTRGSRYEVINIEGDFFERLSGGFPHPVELVCMSCGTGQLGPLQPS